MTDPILQNTDYQTKVQTFEAMAEMSKKEQEAKNAEHYFKAYLWSFLLPPIGIYYFVKYVFFQNNGSEDVKAGTISLVITLVTLIASIVSLSVLLHQTASVLPKSDSKILQELITPENQKTLQQLYK